jgi:carbon monoxide dehydrogenase subunit G
MTQVLTKIMIHAPADAIWQVISDLRAACQYLPGVGNCTVEGEGVGALRTLTSADGSAVVERLEALDEAAHRLSYALLTDTPFGNCLTTVTVRDLGPSQAELEWSATFQAAGIPASEAMEMLEGALAANCLALKQFMEAGGK